MSPYNHPSPLYVLTVWTHYDQLPNAESTAHAVANAVNADRKCRIALAVNLQASAWFSSFKREKYGEGESACYYQCTLIQRLVAGDDYAFQ